MLQFSGREKSCYTICVQKEERTTDTHTDMNESEIHFAEGKRPDMNENILCDIIT